MSDGAVQTKRKVRLGMVGGGPGSNIGETHRYAARIDNRYDLVAGVFATDAARSQAFAQQLGIAPDRRCADWQELVAREAGREDGVLAHAAGVAPDPLSTWYPTVDDGVWGVRFVDAAVASHAAGGGWVKV